MSLVLRHTWYPEDLPSAGLFDHVEVSSIVENMTSAHNDAHNVSQSFPSVEFTDVPDRPLIAPLAPMITIREEYENGSQGFVRQIDWLLSEGWIGIRRTRGDGQSYHHLGISLRPKP